MTSKPTFSLRFGDIIGQSIRTHCRNFVPFTLLAMIAMAPWIVWRIYTSLGETGKGSELVAIVFQSLGSQVLVGALTFGVVQHMRGEPPDLGQTIAVGVKSFLRVIGVGIVVGLLIGLGTLLFIVPGIILTICYYVAIPAAVLERKGIGESMRRSLDLTRGSRWQIFGAVFLFGIIMVVAGMVLGFLSVTMLDAATLPMWLEIALNVLIAPFGSTMASATYYMLRSGKENVDAKQIAAVFD